MLFAVTVNFVAQTIIMLYAADIKRGSRSKEDPQQYTGTDL